MHRSLSPPRTVESAGVFFPVLNSRKANHKCFHALLPETVRKTKEDDLCRGRVGAWEGAASPANGASFALPTTVVHPEALCCCSIVAVLPLIVDATVKNTPSKPSYSLNSAASTCAPSQTRQWRNPVPSTRRRWPWSRNGNLLGVRRCWAG